MTREEAIKALEIELNQWEADCKSYHAVKEAFPMAIEALKNENALIDRMLEIIDKTDSKSDNTSAFDFGFSQACSEIREAVLALKGGDRDCDNCKHYVAKDGQTGCEAWECDGGGDE